MPVSSKKYLLILALLSLPLFFINVHDGHSWGDDFAQYIKEAQNIAHGKPYYQSDWIFTPYNTVYAPPQYPPGFPLLLAPVVKIWGLAFRPMFLFNSFLVVCLLFALFAYFTRKGVEPALAVCLALLIGYNGYMLDMKGNVLADIPCLLFTTLFLAFRQTESFSWRRICLLILFCAIAVQMRSQAIFLLAAEALLWFSISVRAIIKDRKNFVNVAVRSPSPLIITGVLLVNFFIDHVIFATPANTSVFYGGFIHAAMRGNMFISARDNLFYLFKTISGFFNYENSNSLFNALLYLIQCAGLSLAVLGFVVSVSKRLAFDNFFFVIMCGLVLLYPVHDARYFLPGLPILFWYCYVALRAIVPAVSRIEWKKVMTGITVVYLLLGTGYMKRISAYASPGLMPQPRDMAAFRYIIDHVSDTDVIVFPRPRALALFTGKKTACVNWEVSLQRNKQIFDSIHVKYMLVIGGFTDDFFTKYMAEVQHPVDSVKINWYTLYSLY